MRINNQVEWEIVLFNLEFLDYYGFSHWSELSFHPEQTVFLLDPHNRIEIKQGSKLIMRFRSNELDTDTTFFPMYKTSFVEVPIIENAHSKHLTLLLFEKGLIGKYKFESETFSIEQMHYILSSIGKTAFLRILSIRFYHDILFFPFALFSPNSLYLNYLH